MLLLPSAVISRDSIPVLFGKFVGEYRTELVEDGSAEAEDAVLVGCGNLGEAFAAGVDGPDLPGTRREFEGDVGLSILDEEVVFAPVLQFGHFLGGEPRPVGLCGGGVDEEEAE